MEILLAYLAGLLTLINPCILPVLPMVLGSALQASPRGPLALAAGLALSFVTLGLLVTWAGYAIGLSAEAVARGGAVLLILFGLALLLPALAGWLGRGTAGLSFRAEARLRGLRRPGAPGQFLGGLLLGAVWSPCIGPTLGGAIALAATGQDLGLAAAIMAGFALGVATLILGLGHGLRGLLQRNRARAQRLAAVARPLLGALFVALGLAIVLNLPHLAEGWALRILPPWLLDLSVSL
ncbi:sulfite exporter TauE/SafE family protein [Pseudooceanicola sp. CBS1P-1]|uniref:Cytochrome c biogenesis protein CcdA n=1 Tax=Pseudooceanicola albus TaxID=2692189 RepID=A0A6L7FYX4_9RHOB|nr:MULTISPECIES: cytochrome c biogenesis protein CcdA [Pseudooceanicola]MBT9383945.1 sulfite exporter TauE/SafE family protein [Pseudooceanicola endophyticus]MXN16642.1 cytochrome c biogenesis protein CcdA [Pseudooceanicola albus]